MSQNENATNEPQNQGESTPTGGEAPTENEQKPAVEPTPEFRYAPGSGVPTWLEGKTATEAAEIAANLYNATLTQTPQQAVPQQPQPAIGYPAAPQPVQQLQQPVSGQPVASALPTQDDFLTAPDIATQKTVTNMYDSQVAPAIQNMAVQMADMAKAQVQTRHTDAFNRWGPEIVAMMGQLAPEQTTPQNLDMIVSVVKGNHAGEIEKDAIDRRIQQMMDSDTLRPGVNAEGSPSVSIDNGLDLGNKAFDVTYERGGRELSFSDICEKYNINPSTIDEFLVKTYVNNPSVPENTIEEARKTYSKLLTTGEAFTEGSV